MQENTTTENLVHPLLAARYSPRAFSPAPIPAAQLETLFEAARWAPSAMNEQPWRFIYATNQQGEAYQNLLSCLAEANQVWAKHAPVLVLSIAKASYSGKGAANAHAWHDVGMATANLITQATAEGLFAHIMGGFDAAKAREVLHIPAGYEPVAMLAIGTLGDPDLLPAHLKERETAVRTRKPLAQFVFNGTWKQS